MARHQTTWQACSWRNKSSLVCAHAANIGSIGALFIGNLYGEWIMKISIVKNVWRSYGVLSKTTAASAASWRVASSSDRKASTTRRRVGINIKQATRARILNVHYNARASCVHRAYRGAARASYQRIKRVRMLHRRARHGARTYLASMHISAPSWHQHLSA